ncbi:MAG: sulfatase-like hydrolase/transferase [Phycisphaerae bacterium]|nr:sulfatase-like hydrolase/transferase [Phycisphaerae bacterium]
MTMNRRGFMRTLTGAGLGAALGTNANPASGQQRNNRPNVLFIMTDQHRLDAMGACGNPVVKTPNLDRLASEGMRFERYYVAAFPCSPSRASIMTGLHPQSHGVVLNGITLDAAIPTFASELGKAGYHTTWMGKWHLRGPQAFVPATDDELPRVIDKKPPPVDPNRARNGFQDGIHEGLDYVAYLKKHGMDEPRPGKKVRGGHQTVIENGHSVVPAKHFIETYLTDEAVAYLQRERKADRPFCLGVSYEGPHRPITPPEPWDKMYDPDKMPLPPTINDPMTDAPKRNRNGHWRMHEIDLPKQRDRLKRQLVWEGEMWDLLDRPAWTDRQYRELIAHYYGYISYIDAEIGRILSALDRLGLADNTLVVYTTDHGEFMGGHGCIFKAYMMYEDLMRVPFIARMPGTVPKAKTTQALASSVDLMPTLLDVCGVKPSQTVHGKSLMPVLTGRTDRHHDAVFTSFALPNQQVRMIRTDRYKYVYNWRPRDRDELYDYQSDPNEMNNLAGRPETKDVEADLRRQLLDFMDRINDPWRTLAREAADMTPLTKIDFEFDRPCEKHYWTLYRGLSHVRVKDGKLTGQIDCPGFMVAKLDEPVSADDYPALEITMTTTAGQIAHFYWTTTDRPQMGEPLSIRFPITSDGKPHTYRLDLSKHKEWAGKTITTVRLNPVRRRGAKGTLQATFEIDRIGPPK